ncbi:hypothetical protein AVEN_136716-1, partial [Araneus ventricosus]
MRPPDGCTLGHGLAWPNGKSGPETDQFLIRKCKLQAEIPASTTEKRPHTSI